MVAAIVDAPAQTKTYDGSTSSRGVRARAESILTALGYGTFGRYEIEQRVGGNPSGNDEADYAARCRDERAVPHRDRVGRRVGQAARRAGRRRAGHRRRAARARRSTSSATRPASSQDPTITLHTTADPLVLVQNETVFRDRVYGATGRTADLVQLYTLPPATYSAETGAPYGAGHCNFTTEQRVGVIKLLDSWVREGAVPGSASIATYFPGDESVVSHYPPADWPAEVE